MMKIHLSIAWLLNICSALSVIVAVLGALSLEGQKEQFVVRTSGVALLLFSALSQRAQNGKRLIAVENGFEGRKVRELPSWAQNIVTATGGLSALAVGYLIYFCGDEFPGRKVLLITAAAIVAIAFALSYAPGIFPTRRN